jgi:hypothetical protein
MRNPDTDHVMRYSEYGTYMKVCEYLGKEPTGQFKEVHDFLTGLWEGMEIVVDYRDNRIVFRKIDEWCFSQDHPKHRLLYSIKLYSFFNNHIGMGASETRTFIKWMVEEHLICVVGSPLEAATKKPFLVEEHLYYTVGTPLVGISGDQKVLL